MTNLYLHKLRSALTSLGIIIGVGAVITMLAIGEGAKQKTLRDVNQLGATNIILRSVPPTESKQGGNQRKSVADLWVETQRSGPDSLAGGQRVSCRGWR